jgi:hypothetical protein
MGSVVFALSDDAFYGIITLSILTPLVGLLLFGAFLIVRDTIRQKGRWGIPRRMPECQGCGEPPPVVRMPKTWREALWGGWTCPECGLELDKWGKPHPDQPRPARWKVEEAEEDEDRARRARKKEKPRRRRGEHFQERDEV